MLIGPFGDMRGQVGDSAGDLVAAALAAPGAAPGPELLALLAEESANQKRALEALQERVRSLEAAAAAAAASPGPATSEQVRAAVVEALRAREAGGEPGGKRPRG